MPYPIVNKAEARTYLRSPAESGEQKALPEIRFNDEGSDEDWVGIAEDLSTQLLELLASSKSEHGLDGGRFEAAASPLVHQVLPTHIALADPEFWIWLSVAHCLPVVDGRYGRKRNLKNFGIGGAAENLLYRLWLRAEIAFDRAQSNEYDLARVGDIDFWRSHLFRQGYGDVRTFARALISFQFPLSKKRKSRLKIDQIRALAKQLKRARSNLMFEVMSESRATQFIESEWERIASDIP
ncbi:DUF6339 family protein [Mesorhizobium sp. M1273]|uniref:DUF6339 family protein n=1 Tax=Mesorhizobium sp. M1273 TaxID=2957075 RepID=UPI003337F54F